MHNGTHRHTSFSRQISIGISLTCGYTNRRLALRKVAKRTNPNTKPARLILKHRQHAISNTLQPILIPKGARRTFLHANP